jgi:beta-aspartyl-peptidase (threonine type)
MARIPREVSAWRRGRLAQTQGTHEGAPGVHARHRRGRRSGRTGRGRGAGTSTGGIFLKLLGRVGDTPLPGAGTYATKFGGASSTGLGESMMHTLITKTACDFMRMGLDAQGAASGAINILTNILGTQAGIVVVDNQGGIGFAQNSPQMAHAYMKKGMVELVAGL